MDLPHSSYPRKGDESNLKQVVEYRTQLLALTNTSLYLFERRGGNNEVKSQSKNNKVNKTVSSGGGGGEGGDMSSKTLPPLILRRILELDQIKGLKLSQQADCFLVLSVKQPANHIVPNKDNWTPDSKQRKCSV